MQGFLQRYVTCMDWRRYGKDGELMEEDRWEEQKDQNRMMGLDKTRA